MGRRKTDKPSAYAWVAYMITHQPEEMQFLRKRGTPSETLIKLSEQPVAMTTSDDKYKLVTFPESLNTSKGQKLIFECLAHIDLHLKCIPMKAFDLFQHVKTTVRNRRSDTERNIHMVAEAIIHRAASEFKLEVLFAFDSINAWIKNIYGKELGYNTIRKAIEILAEAKILKVNEWGVRGNRSRATKIELIPVMRKSILTYTSELDDWLMFRDSGMIAVYARESATRQNVLEKAIQHYTDMLAKDNEVTSWADLFFDSGELLVADGKMIEVTIVKEKDDHFNRLLGQLVPAMQETNPAVGQVGPGIRRPGGAGESRSGPTPERRAVGKV